MKYSKYLLIKLAEECNEIAQMAIKTAMFGPDSLDPRETTGETNMKKLMLELADASAVMEELVDSMEEDFSRHDFEVEDYIEKKKEKLQFYYGIAQKEFE